MLLPVIDHVMKGGGWWLYLSGGWLIGLALYFLRIRRNRFSAYQTKSENDSLKTVSRRRSR